MIYFTRTTQSHLDLNIVFNKPFPRPTSAVTDPTVASSGAEMDLLFPASLLTPVLHTVLWTCVFARDLAFLVSSVVWTTPGLVRAASAFSLVPISSSSIVSNNSQLLPGPWLVIGGVGQTAPLFCNSCSALSRSGSWESVSRGLFTLPSDLSLLFAGPSPGPLPILRFFLLRFFLLSSFLISFFLPFIFLLSFFFPFICLLFIFLLFIFKITFLV